VQKLSHKYDDVPVGSVLERRVSGAPLLDG
jgi:hypothetical protein